EVLAGPAALEAVRETALAAGVKAGDPSAALDRLRDVLAASGAAGLFQDKELLNALARVAVDDPARFAAVRAGIRAQVSVRDLDNALKPLLRDQARQRPPALEAAGYRVVDGRVCREHKRDGGMTLLPLCNFTARIVEQVTRDE